MPAKNTPEYEEWLRKYRLKRKAKAETPSETKSSKKAEPVLFPEMLEKKEPPKNLMSKGKKFQVYSKSQGKFLEVEVIRYVPSAKKYLVAREDGKYLYYGEDQMVDSAPSKVEKAIAGTKSTLERKEHKTVVPEGSRSARIEEFVAPVAYDISRNGLLLDASRIKAIQDEILEESKKIKEMLLEKVGHDFNINSSPQTAKVLFDELGYTADDRSTSADNLELLAAGDETSVPALIAKLRSNNKLNGSYLNKLQAIAESSDDGRVRNFISPAAVSGRFTAKFNPVLIEVEVPEGVELEDKIYFPDDLAEVGLSSVCPIK